MPETEQIDPAVGFVQRLREFIYGFMEESKEGNPLLSAIWMGIRGEVPNILNTLEQSPDMVRLIQQRMYYVATGEIPAVESEVIPECDEPSLERILPGDLPGPLEELTQEAEARYAAEVAAAEADTVEAEIAQEEAQALAQEELEQTESKRIEEATRQITAEQREEAEPQAEPSQVEEAAHADQDSEGEAGGPGDRPD